MSRMSNAVIPDWTRSIVGEHLTNFYEDLSEESRSCSTD